MTRSRFILGFCIISLCVVALARARSDPFIDNPGTVPQCRPLVLNFGGSHPPFSMTIASGSRGAGTSSTSASATTPQSTGTLPATSTPTLSPTRADTVSHTPVTSRVHVYGSRSLVARSPPVNLTITGISGTSYRWIVNLSPGLYSIKITDSVNKIGEFGAVFLFRHTKPDSNRFSWTGIFWVANDPQTCLPNEGPSTSQSKRLALGGAIIGGTLGGLAVATIVIWLCWRKRRSGRMGSTTAGGRQLTSDGGAALEPAFTKPGLSHNYLGQTDYLSNQITSGPSGQSSSTVLSPINITTSNAGPFNADEPLSPLVDPLQERPTASAVPLEPLTLIPIPRTAPTSSPTPIPGLEPSLTNSSNRLSVAQLQVLQALVDQNVQGEALSVVLDSMIAAGSISSARETEHRGAARSPAPPAYDFKSGNS